MSDIVMSQNVTSVSHMIGIFILACNIQFLCERTHDKKENAKLILCKCLAQQQTFFF